MSHDRNSYILKIYHWFLEKMCLKIIFKKKRSSYIQSHKILQATQFSNTHSECSNVIKVQVHLFILWFHQDLRVSSARTNEEVNLRLNVHLTFSYIISFVFIIRNPSKCKYFKVIWHCKIYTIPLSGVWLKKYSDSGKQA